jgi:hypothetical protein
VALSTGGGRKKEGRQGQSGRSGWARLGSFDPLALSAQLDGSTAHKCGGTYASDDGADDEGCPGEDEAKEADRD